ncbi:apolipoprotein N-acyltransferase [Qipengyuania sp. JC766]|uniref:apolipoprotein N-acyltransferase n=1 Tax=Qipengyuania sp. JC766 TaxID=3232139 RepID=UPI0034586B86
MSDPQPSGTTALSRRLSAHPRLAALVLGALAACGFPPLGLWPLTLLGVAGLVWLVARTDRLRSAFFIGWLWGFAHLTLANNWIATAFTHQAKMPAFLGWFAVPALCLYLALYPGFAALAARWLARRFLTGDRRDTATLGIALAGSWIVFEWLRGWVFTGYPWPPLGLAFLGDFGTPGLAVVLPWMGTYALSGLLVLLATGLLVAFLARRWLVGGAALAVIAALMLVPAGKGADGTLPYTLVQPNLTQAQLNDSSQYEQQFLDYAALSRPRREGLERRLVLWPEGAIPDYLREGYPQRFYTAMTAGGDPAYARRRIGEAIGPDSVLLTGAQDLELEGDTLVGARNSVTAIDGNGTILGGYDKAHLVPYGEYLALRWLLEPLGAQRLVAGSIDFLPGPGPRTLDLGAHGRAGIQICYEIVFSGQVVDRDARPDYIVAPSVDGWFGSWGPPQHLAQARMRAIEEGLPVLRSTTSGISAIIDARGVVRQHIGMWEQGRLDGIVPPAFEETAFARFGNALALAWAALLIGLSLVASRRRDG